MTTALIVISYGGLTLRNLLQSVGSLGWGENIKSAECIESASYAGTLLYITSSYSHSIHTFPCGDEAFQ